MKIKVLIILFLFIFRIAAYSQNKNDVDSLVFSLNQTQNAMKRARTLEQLSLLYYYLLNFDKSAEYSKQLIEHSIEEGFVNYHLSALIVLGNSYYMQAEYNAALKEFNSELIVSLRNYYPKNIAKACQNVSKLYGKQGKYIKATSFAIKSIKIFNEIKDIDNLLYSKGNLSELYLAQKDYKKALDIQNEMLDYYILVSDTLKIAYVYEIIGVIKFYENNYNEALQFYEKSLELSKKTENLFSIAITQGNIAEVFEVNGDYEKALDHYFKALEFEKEINLQSGIIFLYYGIGNTYKKMRNFKNALNYLNKSLQLINKTGEISMKPSVLNSIAQTYVNNGDFKNAYKFNIEYQALNDSLLGIAKMKEIKKLQAEYQFDKKEQEIEKQKGINKYDKLKLKQKQVENLLLIAGIFSIILILIFILLQRNKAKNANIHLALKNNEILKKSQKLDVLNKHMIKLSKFKQAMTGMIVHDLKNPLNTIINSDNIVYTKHSGRHMLLMVQNILDIQKFEEAELNINIKNESLYKISQEAITQVLLLIETKNLNVINNISTEYGVLADEDKTKRVFVNILTNAIKYTPNRGSITLNCETLENNQITETDKPQIRYYEVSISDTGTGIPEDKIDVIFDMFEQVEAKKSGTIYSTGIGLTFCKLAIEAQGGKIEAKSKLNKGSVFLFTLPKGENISNELPVEQYKRIELKLTPSDKRYLEPFITELKELEVYDISESEKILNKIDTEKSKGIADWKNKMENTIFITDEDIFAELLSMKNFS